MKYFTMAELDEITRELLENPSKETLKRLNEKYNGVENMGNAEGYNWVESPNEYYTENSHNYPLSNSFNDDTQNGSQFTSVSQEANTIKDTETVEKNPLLDIQTPKNEEPIVNPLMEIEPYNSKNSGIKPNIQKEKPAEVKSLTSMVEESINNSNKVKEKIEEKTIDTPIEILPYGEYMGNTSMDTSINIVDNNNELPNIQHTTQNVAPVNENTIQNNVIYNNQNMNPVNSQPTPVNNQMDISAQFNNNLTENTMINSMMQTTDNFNTSMEFMPNPTNNVVASEFPGQANNQNFIPTIPQNIMMPTYGQYEGNYKSAAN